MTQTLYNYYSFIIPESFKSVCHSLWLPWISKCVNYKAVARSSQLVRPRLLLLSTIMHERLVTFSVLIYLCAWVADYFPTYHILILSTVSWYNKLHKFKNHPSTFDYYMLSVKYNFVFTLRNSGPAKTWPIGPSATALVNYTHVFPNPVKNIVICNNITDILIACIALVSVIVIKLYILQYEICNIPYSGNLLLVFYFANFAYAAM